MAFGTKYRCEYYDNGGLAWKWDFEWDGYTDAVNTMQASGNPGTYEPLADSDDLFDNPIRGIKATLRVRATSSFQYIDFYTINDLTIRCSIYYGSTLYFQGWVQARTYSEPYDDHLTGPEIVITAICGLGALKNIAYDDNGTPYTGHKFESQIILDILAKINAVSFTEIVNVYEESMTATTGYSPMDQITIDVSVFDEMLCYDVLAHLLTKWNALIRQWKGVFHIYRPKEMISTTAYYRTFTAATTKTAGNVNYVQSIKRTGVTSDLRDHNGGTMMLVAPAKKITLRQDFGYKDSWLLNWGLKSNTFDPATNTFNNWTCSNCFSPVEFIPEEKDGLAITAVSNRRDANYYASQSFGSNLIATSDILGFSIDYFIYSYNGTSLSNVYLDIKIKDDSSNQYLKIKDEEDLEWDTSEAFISILVATVENGRSGWVNFSRTIADGLPNGGSYTITIYNPYCATSFAFFAAFKNIKIFSTSDSIVIKFKKYTLATRGIRGFFDRIYRWMYGTGHGVQTYVDMPEVVQKDYIITNAINGDEIERGHILGDVLDADVSIDNIIEQFKGALCTYISQYRVDKITLSTGSGNATITCNGVAKVAAWTVDAAGTAEEFVNNYGMAGGDYYLSGVQVSFSGADIIFTSLVLGADFTGSTTIVGDYTGTVSENDTPSSTGLEPTSDWNTRGGSESDPLLELIGTELGVQFSRPRQLLTLPIWDLTGADTDPHVNIIGTFKDSLNLISPPGSLSRVFAFNRGTYDMKNRHWDMDVIELVDNTVPDGDPSALTATAASSTQIDLAWTNGSADEDGISIERSLDQVTWVEIATVAAAETTYSNTGLTAETTYYYRVRAFKNLGYSDYSNTDSDTTDSESSYDADLVTYISGLSTELSSGQLTLLNTFILAIKSGLSITNLSDAFDVMYILAGETAESSLRNLVKRAHDATANGSPTFVALEGYTGGTGKYLDTNYNPATNSSKFTLNNASFGLYIRTSRSYSSSKIHGATDGTNATYIYPLRTATNARVQINTAASTNGDPVTDTTIGVISVHRYGETSVKGAKNKTFGPESAASSSGLTDGNIYLLGRNSSGSLASADDVQLSMAWLGAALNQTELDALIDAFEAYMDANGKGVIA